MAKLFIFSIGGTGSRVLEALTMLLASGVKIEADEIIPIIVDPDGGNGNLDRGVEALKKYCAVRDAGNKPSQSMFFGSEVSNLTANAPFIFNLSQVQGTRFKDYIDYDNLDQNSKALIASLFTQENLQLDMTEGFKGNPNIGSIVLDQFIDSADFTKFCNRFAAGDRIFIISSIFGGTGAAGFPLLLKNLRQAHSFQPAIPNAAAVSGAVIGAITYLPYFNLNVPNNDCGANAIDSATFISKSTSALKYYINGVNEDVNALYYMGDPSSFSNSSYAYAEGSGTQRNKAHFTELLGALAIVNFMGNDNFRTDAATFRPTRTLAFDYALDEEGNIITFNMLGSRSKKILSAPLTQFALMGLYMEQYMSQSLSHSWATDGGKEANITDSFFTSNLYLELRQFNALFKEWILQLRDNKISFAPLNLNANSTNLFKALLEDNNNPHTTFLERGENFDRMNHVLNKISGKMNKEAAAQRFLPLFYEATASIVKDKYGFNK